LGRRVYGDEQPAVTGRDMACDGERVSECGPVERRIRGKWAMEEGNGGLVMQPMDECRGNRIEAAESQAGAPR
jgi:hypothetical protein